MNIGEDLAQCIYCHDMKPVQDMNVVFKTGFVQEHGISYPLGICVTCHEKDEGMEARHQVE